MPILYQITADANRQTTQNNQCKLTLLFDYVQPRLLGIGHLPLTRHTVSGGATDSIEFSVKFLDDMILS